jgi:hypothetical protein
MTQFSQVETTQPVEKILTGGVTYMDWQHDLHGLGSMTYMDWWCNLHILMV